MEKKKLLPKQYQTVLIHYLILALTLNIVLEVLNRRSILDCFGFIVHSPIVFIYNVLVIFVTLSITLFAKRRCFFVTVITSIWMALGITNFIVLGYRTTPFSAIDMTMLESVLGMIHIYFSNTQIILIGSAILAVIGLLVYLWIRAPKLQKREYMINSAVILVISIVALSLFTKIGIYTKILSSNFENLSYAYKNYGFAYCFSNSIIDVGIDEPKGYNKDVVDTITSPDVTEPGPSPSFENVEKPNVIFVQLESFFDPNHVTDITLSENPVPTFTKLKEEFSSGFLTVPSIGAGTANTEFEVLTGMSTAFFGAGEYPYKTILQDVTCESMAYLFNKQDYKTHAIHNNDGTFYGRNVVFGHLGFMTFTPIEYMYNVEENPIGWAKDHVLVEEISKCLNQTDDRDFVFTVSVQGHGGYPSNVVDTHQKITIDGLTSKQTQFEYYVNQIHEMDNFIADLITALKARHEPTVLVLYGDHLPTLGLTDERIDNKNMYQTEYVVWNNINLPKEDKDLYAYQLSTHIFEQLGMELGVMQKFHKDFEGTENYSTDMEILEYDLLYGNRYALPENNVSYDPVDIQMGIDKIQVNSVTKIEDKSDYVITGENFNEYTKVYVNNEILETEFIDSEHIMIKETTLVKGDSLTTGQVGVDHKVLGFSNELVIN